MQTSTLFLPGGKFVFFLHSVLYHRNSGCQGESFKSEHYHLISILLSRKRRQLFEKIVFFWRNAQNQEKNFGLQENIFFAILKVEKILITGKDVTPYDPDQKEKTDSADCPSRRLGSDCRRSDPLAFAGADTPKALEPLYNQTTGELMGYTVLEGSPKEEENRSLPLPMASFTPPEGWTQTLNAAEYADRFSTGYVDEYQSLENDYTTLTFSQQYAVEGDTLPAGQEVRWEFSGDLLAGRRIWAGPGLSHGSVLGGWAHLVYYFLPLRSRSGSQSDAGVGEPGGYPGRPSAHSFPVDPGPEAATPPF